MSAVSTERRGSFLKDDFAPSVAANLRHAHGEITRDRYTSRTHQRRPNPLSRRVNNSGVKNMRETLSKAVRRTRMVANKSRGR